MEDFPYEFDLEHLIGVARAAQREIMVVYGEDPADWNVEAKADESPVTKADLRANAVICDALRQKYPAIPITSEVRPPTPCRHHHDSLPPTLPAKAHTLTLTLTRTHEI